MRASRLAAVLAILTGSTGCGAASVGPDGPATPVPVERLSPGPLPFLFYSGLTERQRLVIRDTVTWRDTWDRMWRGHSPHQPLPEVDFSKDMLIVTALGERPTGGYAILIQGAMALGDDLTIQILSISPGPACGRTLALTAPVDVAQVPRIEGRVHFEEHAQERTCQ